MILSRKLKFGLLAFILFGLTSIVMVNFTDACRLKEVDLNGKSYEAFGEKFGLNENRSIIHQPLNNLAEDLLDQKDIYKVEIDRSFPGKIEIHTNNFTPLCYLLDRYSGDLCGLDAHGRMLPLENSQLDWENPIFTSVKAGKMFKKSSDVRVQMVVNHLIPLKKNNIELYRLIDEIDFGNKTFLKVSIAGINYRLKVKADRFYDDMMTFVQFVSCFKPDLTETKLLDMTYSGMVVCSKGKR